MIERPGFGEPSNDNYERSRQMEQSGSSDESIEQVERRMHEAAQRQRERLDAIRNTPVELGSAQRILHAFNQNPYERLGVGRDATNEQIDAAAEALAARYPTDMDIPSWENLKMQDYIEHARALLTHPSDPDHQKLSSVLAALGSLEPYRLAEANAKIEQQNQAERPVSLADKIFEKRTASDIRRGVDPETAEAFAFFHAQRLAPRSIDYRQAAMREFPLHPNVLVAELFHWQASSDARMLAFMVNRRLIANRIEIVPNNEENNEVRKQLSDQIIQGVVHSERFQKEIVTRCIDRLQWPGKGGATAEWYVDYREGWEKLGFDKSISETDPRFMQAIVARIAQALEGKKWGWRDFREEIDAWKKAGLISGVMPLAEADRRIAQFVLKGITTWNSGEIDEEAAREIGAGVGRIRELA